MSSLTLRTSCTEFEAVSAKYDFVPVRAVIDGIGCRPLDAFRTLRELGTQKINGPGFILESESPEAGASRYSYVCPLADSAVRTGERETLGDIDPIQALRNRFESRTVAPVVDLPGLISGAFGYVAYEAITHFEPSVGDLPEDPTGSPVSVFVFPRELLVFDHLLDQLHIIVFASSPEDQYDAVTDRISGICHALEIAGSTAQLIQAAEAHSPTEQLLTLPPPISTKYTEYPAMVRRARNAIIEGELIQVVLGQ